MEHYYLFYDLDSDPEDEEYCIVLDYWDDVPITKEDIIRDGYFVLVEDTLL